MRCLVFLAFVLVFAFICFLPACVTSDSSDDSAGDETDDDTSGDSDDSIDDDSIGDDSVDDDVFPSNIELYGTIDWFEGGGPHMPYYNYCAILRYTQKRWDNISTWSDCFFYSIGGSSPTDIYAVGIQNTPSQFWIDLTTRPFMVHFDGVQWNDTQYPGIEWTFESVYGTSATDIYIVGNTFPQFRYMIYRYDGSFWKIDKTGSPNSRLEAVWASPSGLVAAVGYDESEGYLLVTKENGIWRETRIAAYGWGKLSTVWGAPDDVIFAAGGELNPNTDTGKTTVFHYIGGNWEELNAPGLENAGVNKLIGVSSIDLYLIGNLRNSNDKKGLWHYDGISWTENIIPAGDPYSTESLGDLWVAGHDSVIVSITCSYYTPEYPCGRTLYFNGNDWHTLSKDTGPQALWGFVVP